MWCSVLHHKAHTLYQRAHNTATEINQNMMDSTESPVTPPFSNNASIQPEAVVTKTADANKET
jgi:hypothetical protein